MSQAEAAKIDTDRHQKGMKRQNNRHDIIVGESAMISLSSLKAKRMKQKIVIGDTLFSYSKTRITDMRLEFHVIMSKKLVPKQIQALNSPQGFNVPC